MLGKVLKWILVSVGALGVLATVGVVIGALWYFERSAGAKFLGDLIFPDGARANTHTVADLARDPNTGGTVLLFDESLVTDARSGWSSLKIDNGVQDMNFIAYTPLPFDWSFNAFADPAHCTGGQKPVKKIMASGSSEVDWPNRELSLIHI